MARIIKAGARRQTQAPLGPAGLASGPQEPAATTAELAVRGLDDLATETRTVMLDARRQAATIVAEARTQANASCDAASAKGYARGLARGQEDGCRKGQAEARQKLDAKSEEVVAQLRTIVRELTEARAEVLHAGRCELLDFALDLAAKIVGRVAVRDISAARENVRKALELTDRARELCVKVNPDQLEALAEHMPELTESLHHTGRVRLVGDKDISPGGAKLHTAGGEIDATIETQLANIVEVLLGSRVSRDDLGRYVATDPAPVEIEHTRQGTT